MEKKMVKLRKEKEKEKKEGIIKRQNAVIHLWNQYCELSGQERLHLVKRKNTIGQLAAILVRCKVNNQKKKNLYIYINFFYVLLKLFCI